MRRSRLAIISVLAIPALVAFQVACGTAMLCNFGSSAIVICPMESGEGPGICIMACELNEPRGCDMMETPQTDAGDCCASKPEYEPEPTGGCHRREPAVAGREIESACGGHGKMIDVLNAGSPWVNGCETTDREPMPCEDSDHCPGDMTDCGICLASHYVAELPHESDNRSETIFSTPLDGATLALADADCMRMAVHSHSPPTILPAKAGVEICIAKSSWLL